ncbi:MAG: LuxR C-terminal-related transcriptional regulator [Gammaproteobacteria bacterium]|nr:LuxR C-terminal-related transcriptional regulator [Gammaproteobacteria bacterium]
MFSTGEAAFAVNRGGVIMAWNLAAESTFGFLESEAVGQHCWALLAGKDLFGNQYCWEACPLCEMAFREKSVKSNEMFFKTADNEMSRFSVCFLVLYDGPGNELLLHMCRPQCETDDSCVTGQPTANHQRGTLTNREKEVLTLLSQGRGTNEIASDMCISSATVCNHIQHILYKLRVHSRMAAVNQGQKLGLI